MDENYSLPNIDFMMKEERKAWMLRATEAEQKVHELESKIQRVADWIVNRKELCPHGAPGWERPCAGTPIQERMCLECTIQWINR